MSGVNVVSYCALELHFRFLFQLLNSHAIEPALPCYISWQSIVRNEVCAKHARGQVNRNNSLNKDIMSNLQRELFSLFLKPCMCVSLVFFLQQSCLPLLLSPPSPVRSGRWSVQADGKQAARLQTQKSGCCTFKIGTRLCLPLHSFQHPVTYPSPFSLLPWGKMENPLVSADGKKTKK